MASILTWMVIPNYSVYVVNNILSFVILSMLFYRISSVTARRLMPFASVIFIVCTAVSIANGDGIKTYNSVVSAVSSFIITAYCLLFFYWRLVKDNGLPSLTNSALFWIIIGIFTYYTGSFFIFISYKYLIFLESNVIGILWRFHNVLLTIFCSYTIYGLTCKNYQKT